MSSGSAARRSLTKKQAALLVTVGGIVLGLAACSASSSGTATSSSAKSAESPTSARDIGFANWTAFGVKAANVATLRTFALPDVFVPDGYAVPFYFYDKFMSFNGLYDRMARMLKDPKFRSNPTYQDEQLAEFRDAIRNSPMQQRMIDALTKLQKSFPEETGIRCLSSTNNEDPELFRGRAV